jgi:hypothetical protein
MIAAGKPIDEIRNNGPMIIITRTPDLGQVYVMGCWDVGVHVEVWAIGCKQISCMTASVGTYSDHGFLGCGSSNTR